MFKSKTLLVLGAGASREVDMPLGTDLISDIGRRLDIQFNSYCLESGSPNIVDALRLHASRAPGDGDQDISPYVEAAQAIRDMAPMAKSIDDVIDRRNNAHINLCGKLAIAECILDAERASALFIPPPSEQQDQTLNHYELKNSWLYSFINVLIEGVSRRHIGSLFDNISVISFNYDRCFSYFLVNALKLQYGLRLEEAQDIVSGLKIIYPYGTISPLEFEDSSGLRFGARVNGEKLLDISGKIRTFTEQVSENEVITSIKNEVASANQIIFLGFAFHAQNLGILAGQDLSKKRIIGTTFDISEPNTLVIERDLKYALKMKASPPLDHDLTLKPLRCAGLFHEYSRVLAS